MTYCGKSWNIGQVCFECLMFMNCVALIYCVKHALPHPKPPTPPTTPADNNPPASEPANRLPFELCLKFEREPAGLANKNASVRCLERRRIPIG
jgi:hypothetical protein